MEDAAIQLELGAICKVKNEGENQELFFTTSFAKKKTPLPSVFHLGSVLNFHVLVSFLHSSLLSPVCALMLVAQTLSQLV